MEAPKDQITLDKLPIGSRLLVRSRKDWRFAAISKIVEERVTLTVCSPSGYTYRLRRPLDCEVFMDGIIPIVAGAEPDDWHENFGKYDHRW